MFKLRLDTVYTQAASLTWQLIVCQDRKEEVAIEEVMSQRQPEEKLAQNVMAQETLVKLTLRRARAWSGSADR